MKTPLERYLLGEKMEDYSFFQLKILKSWVVRKKLGPDKYQMELVDETKRTKTLRKEANVEETIKVLEIIAEATAAGDRNFKSVDDFVKLVRTRMKNHKNTKTKTAKTSQ